MVVTNNSYIFVGYKHEKNDTMSNIPVIFRFLKDLTANNNREWFNEHREEYEIARLEFEKFPFHSNCPYFTF